MLDGVLQQCDTPQKLFHRPANLFVAAFMGSPAMNVVEAEVADGQVRFAGLTVPLAQGSPLAGASRAVILGIRPTDLRPPDEAPAGLPVITVRPDQIEELGGLSNLLFPLEAPRVQTDATRAAIEATGDDDATLLADDLRARFCATIDGRREVRLGEEIELAVDQPVPPLLRPGERARDHERRRGCGCPSRSSAAVGTGERRRHEVERVARAHQVRFAHRSADPRRRADRRGLRTAPPNGAVRPARRRAGRPRCRRP